MTGQRWQPLAALALTVVVAAVIVAAQPIRAPWWYHADADATYTASSLNLAGGEHVVFLGHPGLPLQQVLASAFLLEHAAGRVAGNDESIREFTDARLVDLDRTRALYRGLGVAAYLLGAIALCLAAARVTASWLWGAWAGVLWVGAPNLAPMSIQYRPDSAHAILVIASALLLGRAASTRSPVAFAAGAAVIGAALMVKLHAVGLLVALAAVAALRPPLEAAGRASIGHAFAELRRRRAIVVPAIGLWAVAAVLLNRGQGYPVETSDILSACALFGSFVAGAIVWRRGRHVVARAAGLAVASVCVGLALPISLSIHDGVAALTEIARTTTGGGVNSYTGVETGSPLELFEPLLRQTTVLFALAGVAAIAAWRLGEIAPAVWAIGATALGAMAIARLGTPHYFAPSFVLSVLGVAWLGSRMPRLAGLALAGMLAVWIVGVQFRHRDGGTETFTAIREHAEPVFEREVDRLGANAAVLTPSEHLYLPVPDTHYFEFVRPHVVRTPKSRYRTLPATPQGARFALEEGIELPVYVGPATDTVAGAATARLGVDDTPVARPVDPSDVRRLAEGVR